MHYRWVTDNGLDLLIGKLDFQGDRVWEGFSEASCESRLMSDHFSAWLLHHQR